MSVKLIRNPVAFSSSSSNSILQDQDTPAALLAGQFIAGPNVISSITLSPDEGKFAGDSGGEFFATKGDVPEGTIYMNGVPAVQANIANTILAFAGVSGFEQNVNGVKLGVVGETQGFFGLNGDVKQLAVPVTAAGIHAALVAYDLIT